ncbi:MAG: FG-GAP-like repeat-containing protein [Nitrospirae bacterium]|nr:FG-GAP-like repeat-containing protein [Nitrospirota bacterium]
MTDWKTKAVIWDGVLNEGEYIRLETINTVYRIESSKVVSAIESWGDRAGADFMPTYYAAVTDLEATNIEILPKDIYPGDNILITAMISNVGDTYQENVLAEIYVDDVKISSASVNVNFHAVSEIQANWQATEGNHSIRLVVDPQDAIIEQNELNNTISVNRTVSYPPPPPLSPDLAIASSDVTFSNVLPHKGETITVTANIHNNGSDASNVLVVSYLGSPQNGGSQIGSRNVSNVVSFGSAAFETQWTVDRSAGTYDICFWIDPNNNILEGNETNNLACKSITVVEKDLYLKATTDKSQYPVNSEVGIRVEVQNHDSAPWSGTGEVYIEDSLSDLVSHVASFSVQDLKPVGMPGWAFRIPAPVTASWNMTDTLAGASIDFSAILQALGMQDKTIDQNSIRVLEFDSQSNFLGEKQAKPVLSGSAAKVVWLMDGLTASGATRYFYIYFDITANGNKELSARSELPVTGRLIGFADDMGNVYVIESRGDGTFGTAKFVDDVSAASDYTRGIVLDDFNNDGSLDIVTGSWSNGEIYYYQNRADGTDTFLPKVKIGATTVSSYIMDMVAADLNNDGNKDFVVSSNTANLLYLFRGNGDGTFLQSTIPSPTGTNYFRGKTAGDMNGDGNIDLIVANNAGVIYLYKGNGDGTFLAPLQVTDIGSEPYGLVAGDFDGDGKADVIANNGSTGDTYFLKGKGDGTFGPPALLPTPDTNSYAAFDSGDFNNDGHLDLIAATYSNKAIEFYPGKGDGTFGQKIIIATTANYPLGISSSPALPEVHPVLGTPEAVPSQTFNFLWNTGSTPPGPYKVYVTLSEGQGVVAEDYAPFEILSDIRLDSKVVTDKVSYKANDTATITSTVTGMSANAILENLIAKISISDQQANLLYNETQNIQTLVPGQIVELKTYWNTGTNPPGTYLVTLTVTDGSGNVLSTGSTTLTISSDIKPSVLLKGTISVDKQSLLQGDPVTITYSVTNVGNVDLPSIDLSVLSVHVVTQNVYDTLNDNTSLMMGQTYSNSQILQTTAYTAKDYLVILQATVEGTTETLAGTYFRVEGAPSAPSLNAPGNGSDVETLTPILTVNNASDPNDDKLTYEFELYSDGSLTTLIALLTAIPEGNSMTAWQVPTELQENSTYYWRARAFDGWLYGDWMVPASFRINLVNEPPTAPTLSSPAQNSEVSTLTPVLVVNNATDPDSTNLTYNFDLSLDSGFTQIVSSQIGVFEGQGTTSWEVPFSLNENTYYYWRAQAADWLITGPWMATAKFFINTANEAPEAPVVISPPDNSEITTLTADIIVTNSTDPDSAQLTYFFELDTVPTFDSAGVMRSGSIPGGQETTLWSVSGLTDNTFYYVRVKASDGLAESPWSTVSGFLANTQNDAPTVPLLANPSDGGAVNMPNPVLTVHDSSDIDRDVLTYEFEVYADAAMTSLVTSTTAVQETPDVTSWTVPITFTENNIYYWRVRAFDGELHSGWMPLASFMVNTANDAPGAPILNAPANGTSIDTLNPALAVYNALDPDSDSLTYDFEIYSGGLPVKTITAVPQDASGVTSVTLTEALSDDTAYTWRARAYDGDRYGAWMDTASFSIHLPVTSITATIDFDPNTLNKKSNGKWVAVYIELPSGYNVADIDIASISLNGAVSAEPWPYAIGDCDKDGIPDLMVKFNRSAVINILPNGDNVRVEVTGTVGTTTFEGVDTIRVIP